MVENRVWKIVANATGTNRLTRSPFKKMVGCSIHYLIPEGDRRLPSGGDYFCVGTKKIATGSVQHGFIFDYLFRSYSKIFPVNLPFSSILHKFEET
jgi:hypothetical protein